MSLMLSPTMKGTSGAAASPGALGPLAIPRVPPPSPIVHVGSTHDLPRFQHLYVLPVLLLEFLAIALTRAVLPELLLQQYGDRVYLVMGIADFVRGCLAFFACPLFGKISDVVGRRMCLLITVAGTCAPICSLAFFPWETSTHIDDGSEFGAAQAEGFSEQGVADEPATFGYSLLRSGGHIEQTLHPNSITVFIVLFALSGVFSSTFTLVFAYISDTVRQQDERVSAYGLALATFGLSFTIGPMAGGYLAQSSRQTVFLCSLLLTLLDIVYIYFFLPESKQFEGDMSDKGSVSLMTLDHHFSWNPWDTLRILIVDPFLRKVGQVALLYYTGLWALISTLSVYAVKRFGLSPERLGELMSVIGLCTMVAEAVLVRIMVPMLGEKRAMQVGLISFAMQCIVLGFAYESWHLFICAAFSLLGNLVYPSLSSLVSGSVEPDAVGEALGAINGIKALTEGVGPLVFGALMTVSEKSALPGWPYLIAAVLVVAAYKQTGELPDLEHDDYIHEIDKRRQKDAAHLMGGKSNGGSDDEYEGLLSEIDSDDEQIEDPEHIPRIPLNFASFGSPSRTTKPR